MIIKGIFLVLMSVCLSSCHANPSSSVANQQQEPQQTNPPIFKMIEIPSVLTSPAERAEYLVLNYWNNYNFKDTNYIHVPEVTEQALVNYIDLLPHTTYETAVQSLKQMVTKAGEEKKMLDFFFELYEKYLYDANSPLRNDEYFIPVLESVVGSPVLDETENIRPRNLLQLTLKNRIGEVANDFAFTQANGQKGNMHRLSAQYLLLFFYNPGCHACADAKQKLVSSGVVQSLITNKQLVILAIFPDEDLTEWNKYKEDIPNSWMNAYDQDAYIKNEEVYDLKAIPTVYLLDKDKKVILKDADIEHIVSYLSAVE